ncbi:MAG: alkylhydroperoxidase family enzyme [Gammaproteobacteria bacterium]|jgi:alkylhydroperoxidase family enzyme
MSRIPLVEREGASPEILAMFDRMENLGFSLLNVFKMWAHNSGAAAGFVQLGEALYSESAALSPRYRELAYLRASQINSCHY